MRHGVVIAMLLAGPASLVHAQSLVGAWKAVEFTETAGADSGRHVTDVQPALLIFTASYYSTQAVSAYSPRPLLTAGSPDSLRLRVLRSYIANSGTYKIQDSVVTYTPIVALNPGAMSGRSFTFNFHLHGDTLWTSLRQGPNVVTGRWLRVQ